MPKPKYAIVMSADEEYLPGVNGQLNAYRYYGMEDDGIEFHLIHTFSDDSDYIRQARKIFPKFVPTKLADFMIESGRWGKKGKPGFQTMKYARWWYPAERLSDYDAICVLDADMQIVQNFTHHFDMAAKSGMIALAKNDWCNAEWFSYDEKRAMAANPPICNIPCFVTGKRATEFFPLIPEYAENPVKYYPPYKGRLSTTGDMHAINLILLQKGMIKDLFPLPGTQWVFINTDHVRLVHRMVRRQHHIGIHNKGDLLYTFHRKHWKAGVCSRTMGGRASIERVFGINNARILWELTKFFNTELYLKIDWIYDDFPARLISSPANRWLGTYISTSLRNMQQPASKDVVDELEQVIKSGEAKQLYGLSDIAVSLLVKAGVPVVAALNKEWLE